MPPSTEELRRWCKAKCRRGAGRHAGSGVGKNGGEFSANAFCRALAWRDTEFYAWLRDKGSIPARVRLTMARFIAEWEAGKIAFTKTGWHAKRALIRTPEGRPRPPRSQIDFSSGTPRLRLLPRPVIETAMPSPRELIRGKLTA